MSNESSAGGLSVGTVLFIVFLILKLCNVITWSWWWVTCPLWIPIVVILGILLFVFLVAVIGIIIKSF